MQFIFDYLWIHVTTTIITLIRKNQGPLPIGRVGSLTNEPAENQTKDKKSTSKLANLLVVLTQIGYTSNYLHGLHHVV